MDSKRAELEKLRVGDSIIYCDGPEYDVIRVLRCDESIAIRDTDIKESTIFDFVNGYTEVPEIKSMDDVYNRFLRPENLVGIMSASKRSMTGDVRLYLAAKSRLAYLMSVKGTKIPDYAIEAQTKIVRDYRERLKSYGDACIVLTKDTLNPAVLEIFGTVDKALYGYLDRADAAAKHEAYLFQYYKRAEFDDQAIKGRNAEDMTPTYDCMMYGRFQVESYLENCTYDPKKYSIMRREAKPAIYDQKVPEKSRASAKEVERE